VGLPLWGAAPAGDILEIGAQWSILKKDIPSFERYMAQLKCYYFDYKEELPDSAFRHQLLGLNLLFLLSQNRVAEFHTELERLPARDIQTNVYIRHPVSLEQVGGREMWGRGEMWGRYGAGTSRQTSTSATP
ncbi:26S proteasome non-ATPase regulatory subunit 8, partial [Phasianus colchicus]|uniref:26S proteasome non-ATPase regulatory subunit 8 n=1 Tax=Phasianus colchicus TaxID=9054 RepID=UPI00129D9FEE